MEAAGIGRVLFWEGGNFWLALVTGTMGCHEDHAIQLCLPIRGTAQFKTDPEGEWIAYQGAVALEAIAAAGIIAEHRRDVGVLAVTSADRLNADWTAAQRARARGNEAARSHIETLFADLPRDCLIVTAIDGHPATLAWLGSVGGHKTVSHGVEHFGQTGSIVDLYRHFGLDRQAPGAIGAGTIRRVAHGHARVTPAPSAADSIRAQSAYMIRPAVISSLADRRGARHLYPPAVEAVRPIPELFPEARLHGDAPAPGAALSGAVGIVRNRDRHGLRLPDDIALLEGLPIASWQAAHRPSCKDRLIAGQVSGMHGKPASQAAAGVDNGTGKGSTRTAQL